MVFDVPDPDFEQRIRKSFLRQGFNERVGAILGHVTPGYVEIEVPFSAGSRTEYPGVGGSMPSLPTSFSAA
jgi:hypothetical protein